MNTRNVFNFFICIHLAAALVGCQNKCLMGSNYKLVARHGNYQLYVEKTHNKISGFAFFEGSQCLMLRDTSNKAAYNMTFFNNGVNILDSMYTYDGKLVNQSVYYYGAEPGYPRITYVDTNGDGLWDVFLNYNKNIKYAQSNLCWIPLRKIK